MKRSFALSLIALVGVLVLWACGGAAGPKEAGEKFLNAMAKGDIETAKKYATEDSHSAIDMMAASAITKAANPDKIELGDVKEEGDKATLSYKENGTDKSLELKKVNGEWKAVYTKGGGNGGGMDLKEETEEAAPAAEEAHEEGAEEHGEGDGHAH
jgi:hypothetical protein